MLIKKISLHPNIYDILRSNDDEDGMEVEGWNGFNGSLRSSQYIYLSKLGLNKQGTLAVVHFFISQKSFLKTINRFFEKICCLKSLETFENKLTILKASVKVFAELKKLW